MNVASALVILGVSLLGGAQVQLTADQLVNKAIMSRTQLRTGHIVLTHKYNHHQGPGEILQTHHTYNMYFDKQNFRSDVVWKHPTWSKVTKTVITPAMFICDWSADQRVVTGPASRSKQPGYVQGAFDPRLLGLVPVDLSLLHSCEIEHPFFFINNQHSEAIPVKLNGQDTLRIDYRLSPDRQVRLWLSPEADFGVVRLERENGTPGNRGNGRMVLSSHFKRFGERAYWFPNEIIRSQFNGDALVEEELIQIQDAEFNIDVDPAKFSFAGLGLAPGREVVGPAGKMMIWTGSRLVDEHVKGGPVRDTTIEPHSSSGMRWFWGVNAALCALVVVGLCRRAPRF